MATGRATNLARLVEARSVAVSTMLYENDEMTPEEAETAVPAIGDVPVLKEDIAVAMIAEGVTGVRSYTPDTEGMGGLGDQLELPDWDEFDPDDAAEIWGTWPNWAKESVYQAVLKFSQRAPGSDPKAR